MSVTTNFSPILAPPALLRGTWRARLAGWLTRLASARREMFHKTSSEDLGNHLRHDMGLPPGPSHEERIWGAGGLIWR